LGGGISPLSHAAQCSGVAVCFANAPDAGTVDQTGHFLRAYGLADVGYDYSANRLVFTMGSGSGYKSYFDATGNLFTSTANTNGVTISGGGSAPLDIAWSYASSGASPHLGPLNTSPFTGLVNDMALYSGARTSYVVTPNVNLWLAQLNATNVLDSALTTQYYPIAGTGGLLGNGSISEISGVTTDAHPFTSTGLVTAAGFVSTDTHNGHVDLQYKALASPGPGINTVQFTVDGAVATPYTIPLPTSGPTGSNKYMNCASDPCVWDTGGGSGGGTVTDGSGSTTANQLALATTTAHALTYATTLPAAAVPAFTGDVTNSSGSLALTIAANAVTGAKMANATITATQLAAQYSKGSCTEVWGGSGTSSALTSGDDAISNNTCYNDSGVTRTITAVKCRSNIASNTTTTNPTFGASGTGTTILSGAVTCGSSYAYSSSGSVTNASWTTGTGIDPAMGGTLTGTSIALIVEYTF